MSLDDKCPSCGTPATYELGENNWACKCTYEAETAVTLCECDCMKSGEIRERERIIKLLEAMADEYGQLDLFDVLDQLEEPHIGAKHDTNCNLAQGKWDGGCTCKGEQK